jgi:hypothetical protein
MGKYSTEMDRTFSIKINLKTFSNINGNIRKYECC